MTRLRSSSFVEQVAVGRVKAVANFGFSERQARFLLTVMQHGGVCVPRQYARFAGVAYGQIVNAFFDKLVHDGFVVRCDCVHNRASLYHVHAKPLYRAIGDADSPYRRPIAAGRVVERLTRLDAVLEGALQGLTWLVSEHEKIGYFEATAPLFPRERLPHGIVGRASSRRVRYFPNALPIAVEPTGRALFLYVVNAPVSDEFRAFILSHAELLRALPEWTVRCMVPRHLLQLGPAHEAAFRDELARALSPRSTAELKWYFEQRKLGGERARARSDPRFWQAQRTFPNSRYSLLYRLWLADGDTALEHLCMSAIGEALARGAGRLETVVLPFSYRHLAPLVSLVRQTPSEVEEGEEQTARPQPSHLHSTIVMEGLPVDGYSPL